MIQNDIEVRGSQGSQGEISSFRDVITKLSGQRGVAGADHLQPQINMAGMSGKLEKKKHYINQVVCMAITLRFCFL